jgi:hypothetical protein
VITYGFPVAGSTDLALERWLGHADVLSSIARSWTDMGTFSTPDEITALRKKLREVSSAVAAATGEVDSSAATAASAAASRKHEERLVELGKVNDRNKVRPLGMPNAAVFLRSGGCYDVMIRL